MENAKEERPKQEEKEEQEEEKGEDAIEIEREEKREPEELKPMSSKIESIDVGTTILGIGALMIGFLWGLNELIDWITALLDLATVGGWEIALLIINILTILIDFGWRIFSIGLETLSGGGSILSALTAMFGSGWWAVASIISLIAEFIPGLGTILPCGIVSFLLSIIGFNKMKSKIPVVSVK